MYWLGTKDQCPVVIDGERCMWRCHVGNVHYIARAVMDNGTPSAAELTEMHPELIPAPWHRRAVSAFGSFLAWLLAVLTVLLICAVIGCVFLLAVWGIVTAGRGITR